MMSIVIPTYNRAKHIEEVHRQLEVYLSSKSEAFEIIWVNDGSQDDTDKILEAICQSSNVTKALILQDNVGQQNATLAGIRHAVGDLIVTIDDDLRYGPESIDLLFNELQKGYEIVYGIPPKQDNGHLRHFGTDVKELMFRLMCGKPKGIVLTSFRIMNRSMADWVSGDKVMKTYTSARVLGKTTSLGQVSLEAHEGLILPSGYTLGKLINLMVQVFRNYSLLGQKLGLRREGLQYSVKEILE